MAKLNKSEEFKIKLTYYDSEDNIAIESVWSVKEGDYYRIKNIPFFASNIAYDDLISVENDEGELYFENLIGSSGHSTIQIIIYNETDIEVITNDLINLKCDWEGSHLKGYIAVDIPKEVVYLPIKNYLDNMLSEGILDYKEACLAH